MVIITHPHIIITLLHLSQIIITIPHPPMSIIIITHHRLHLIQRTTKKTVLEQFQQVLLTYLNVTYNLSQCDFKYKITVIINYR